MRKISFEKQIASNSKQKIFLYYEICDWNEIPSTIDQKDLSKFNKGFYNALNKKI